MVTRPKPDPNLIQEIKFSQFSDWRPETGFTMKVMEGMKDLTWGKAISCYYMLLHATDFLNFRVNSGPNRGGSFTLTTLPVGHHG